MVGDLLRGRAVRCQARFNIKDEIRDPSVAFCRFSVLMVVDPGQMVVARRDSPAGLPCPGLVATDYEGLKS